MAQDNPYKELLATTGFSEFFKRYSNTQLNMDTLLDIQKKNIQSFSHAQKLTTHNMMEIAQRQGEIFSQMMQQNTKYANQIMSNRQPEDKLRKNSDVIRKSYKQAMANAREISNMVQRANAETTKILAKRVDASVKEVTKATKKSA